jgi:hypothetical protein
MDNFLDNIPDPLYKYRDWYNDHHKRILTHNEIYLASPDQFNDPYDCTAPFRYRDEDLTPENIFTKLMELAKRHHPEMTATQLHQECFERQQSGIFENGKYWKDAYLEHKNEMNKFGVLSTTSKKDNLLMWAHYANSHNGFCIGLDKFILYNVIRGTLMPVIYDKNLPRKPLLEDDSYSSYLINILATKSDDWLYEDEYRIILNNAARQTFKVPSEIIKEIIFGFKMPEKHKVEIFNLVRAKFPHVRIFQSDMSLNEFKLNMIPILKNY